MTKLFLVGCGVVFFPLIVGSCISALDFGSSSAEHQIAKAKEEREKEKKVALDRLRTFDQRIDQFYATLIEKKSAGDNAGALGVVAQFRKFNRTDYKDVLVLEKRLLTSAALARLKGTEKTDIKGQADAYNELSKLEPENSDYRIKASIFSTQWNEMENKRIAQQQEAALERDRITQREERIKAQFDPRDGSHIELKRMIKETMHNPKSFEHVETRYSDKGYRIIVATKFRGTNGFGGVVTNIQSAVFSENGAFIESGDGTSKQ